MAVQAALAEELPGLENPDNRFLALLGQHYNLDATFLDVEDLVRRLSLLEHGFVLVEGRHGLSLADLRKEGLRVKFIRCRPCHRPPPGLPSALQPNFWST